MSAVLPLSLKLRIVFAVYKENTLDVLFTLTILLNYLKDFNANNVEEHEVFQKSAYQRIYRTVWKGEILREVQM